MNTLTTSPRNGWSLVNDEFDNLFEGFFRPMRYSTEGAKQGLVPNMDITERENDYVIHCEMPGVKKESVDITLADGTLTVSGETNSYREQKDGERVIRHERSWGKFTRSIRLGTQINDKGVKANYKDGILELTLPKAEEVKPKKIAIN